MPALLKEWTVLPHDRLTAVEDNILTVTGEVQMPLIKFPRRMTVVRLNDGRLVIYSAIALDEDEMRRLEEFGRPAFLIVPSDHHRMDAKIWKDRYPKLTVVAPAGARDKVAEAVAVDAAQINFADPDVVFQTVRGTGSREAALQVLSAGGTTLIVNDVIANIADTSGLSGKISQLMGFAGDAPQIPLPEKLAMVDDRAALAAQFRRWAAISGLRRIIVSHGDTIESDPAGVLRALAAKLD